MLRVDPVSGPLAESAGVVLSCGDPACGHTFEPDRIAFEAGALACPECDGWTFQAQLAEPTTTAGGARS